MVSTSYRVKSGYWRIHELQNEGGSIFFISNRELADPPTARPWQSRRLVLRAESYDLFYSKAECTKKAWKLGPWVFGGFLTQHSRDKWGEPPTPWPKSWISSICSLLPENRLQCFQTFLLTARIMFFNSWTQFWFRGFISTLFPGTTTTSDRPVDAWIPRDENRVDLLGFMHQPDWRGGSMGS